MSYKTLSKSLFTLSLVVLLAPCLKAQSPSLTEELKTKEKEQINVQQIQSEDLRRLQDEKSRLEKRLVETVVEITKIQSVTDTVPKSTDFILTSEKLHEIMTQKTFGSCTVEPGESEREYIITKKNQKMRFVFLNTTDRLAPRASLTKNDIGEDLVQVLQPGFNPSAIDSDGEMDATIRFSETTNNTTIEHAVFNGQRIDDKSFFKKMFSSSPSSFDYDTFTCAL